MRYGNIWGFLRGRPGVGILAAGLITPLAPPALTPPTAPAARPLAQATIYDVFWAPRWNRAVGLASLSERDINRFVERLLASPYLAGLRQYGVASPRYGGSLPAYPACGRMAPAKLSPANIAAFAACEVRQAALPVPKGGLLINVFLPPTTRTDYPAPVACLGLEGKSPLGLVNYHGTSVGHVPGPPIAFAAVSAGCAEAAGGGRPFGSPYAHLTWATSHEMVEALTDPLPGLGWDDRHRGGNGEAADLCEPPVPPVPFGQGMVTRYWSNRLGACVAPGLGPPYPPPVQR